MTEGLLLSTGMLFELLAPFVVFLVTLILGFIIRRVLFRRLHKWTEKTKTKFDDIIVVGIKTPFILWFLILGIYLAVRVADLPPDAVNLIGKILFVFGAGSIILVLANISSRLIREYSYRVETVLPVTNLTQNLVRITIIGIGILLILNNLGISITPILATLGVGGLAVALALQDTLANLFSGFYITLARHVRVGDFIKLESGEEGYVMDIGWRATRIRMLSNNVVLIPNAKLSQSIITNYYLPDKELAVLVQVGVHYNSDLEHVERVTIEVAREVMKTVPGGVPEFEPFIRYHTFGDFSINFTVIMRAREFVDNYLIKHEFIKRLHKRYAQEGITIPYPIRAINYAQEKAG